MEAETPRLHAVRPAGWKALATECHRTQLPWARCHTEWLEAKDAKSGRCADRNQAARLAISKSFAPTAQPRSTAPAPGPLRQQQTRASIGSDLRRPNPSAPTLSAS